MLLRFFIFLNLFGYFQAVAQPFSKKYLMSFHSCAIPNCGGPQNHTTQLAQSDDGENWTLVPNFPSYTGSVPDVITRGDYLFIFTPGKVKRYNQLLNQWDANPVQVSIQDGIGNPVQFADPSAIVDDNNLIVLFFLNTTGIVGDPALCPNPPCTAYFDSAIEVAGSNGTQFTLQSGHRLSYTTNANFKPTDPDIFKKDNLWYLYISYGNGTMVYTANQLHGNYNQVATLPNGFLTNTEAGIPCGMYHATQNLFFSYGHKNMASGSEITLAKHNDFSTQQAYTGIITGAGIGLGNVQVASPGICDNTFLTTQVFTDLNAAAQFSISPNPSNGKIYLTSREEIKQIQIVNIWGQIVQSKIVDSPQKTVVAEIFPKGLYFVRVLTRSGECFLGKFLIH